MVSGKKIGIVLSGTAPSMTLMSGAMLAFAERGIEFDIISTTGVGGLIGLLYMAPKGKSRAEALRALPNLFVSDWLYRFFPVNFKVFHKYTPFAAWFWERRKSLPKFDLKPDDPSDVKRFLNDWLEVWATAFTPMSYRMRRNGLMSHVPLVEDLVDFKTLNAKVKKDDPKFYLSAFSLRTRKLRFFSNEDMNADAYNAAQAMYALFPPVQTHHDLLTTGATRDPTGLQAIWTKPEGRQLELVLVLDPISQSFWRIPASAYDAFQLMLMNPIAALQELTLTLYWNTQKALYRTADEPQLPCLYRIPVSIEESYYPHVLEWSHSNAVKLQKIGYDAAVDVAKALAPFDKDRLEADYSFDAFMDRPRATQFLKMFPAVSRNTPDRARAFATYCAGKSWKAS